MQVRPRAQIGLVGGLVFVLSLAGLRASQSASAQSMQVAINNFSFQPASLTVPVGTTVTWSNQDSVAHTTTSDTGVWGSGNLTTGASFSFAFNRAGTFHYHCMIHPNMMGTIVVQAAAVAGSTATPASPIPLTAYPARTQGAMNDLRMGPVVMMSRPSWLGYYDGHKDAYLNTDVSDKAQAGAMHINYAPSLAHMPLSRIPAIYLVQGRAVGVQIAVFGSQPGASDYSPLWREVIVQWKPHVKPVLLGSDNQILALVKKGKLVIHSTRTVLNCPIVKVSK